MTERCRGDDSAIVSAGFCFACSLDPGSLPRCEHTKRRTEMYRSGSLTYPSLKLAELTFEDLERARGFEPPTPTLARLISRF